MNSTYMQRNVSTPNLSADLFDDLGWYIILDMNSVHCFDLDLVIE